MRFLFLATFFLLVICLPAYAQTNTETFPIRLFTGSDSIPPTTPALTAVTPIAQSQIDVAWSAATDNYIIGGYSLLRDGSAIATTSLTSFSDTGLAASTTYSYSVRAFDLAGNYSSTSAAIATTTFAIIPSVPTTTPTTTTATTQSTQARVVLKNLQIQTGVSTTSFQLETALPARVTLRWGKTASYELGYIVREVYLDTHLLTVTDLEPGTKYEYELIGYTPYGFPTVLKTGQFSTADPHAFVAPMNVNRFKANTAGDDVKLTWQFANLAGGHYVRIVRSHLGFPQFPQDGAIVYQGRGVSAVDVGILGQYSPAYYTAFVFDAEGNVSSGAVAVAYAQNDPGAEAPFVSDLDSVGQIGVITEATSSVQYDRVPPETYMPSLDDIRIIQGVYEYGMSDINIVLSTNERFILLLPRELVSAHLKTIIVTLIDPTDNRQTYSFMLRINKQQTAYEAMIAPLGIVGTSGLTVQIYDYESQVVGTYQAPITFVLPVSAGMNDFTQNTLFPILYYLALILGGMALFWLLLLIFKRRAEDKDGERTGG